MCPGFQVSPEFGGSLPLIRCHLIMAAAVAEQEALKVQTWLMENGIEWLSGIMRSWFSFARKENKLVPERASSGQFLDLQWEDRTSWLFGFLRRRLFEQAW